MGVRTVFFGSILGMVLVVTMSCCSDDAGPQVTDAVDGDAVLEIVEQDVDLAVCPHGANPSGNGCLLPCKNGWHDGADGQCHINCPTGLSEDASGRCTVPICPEGTSETPWTATFEGASLEGTACIRGCPPGMQSVGEGFNLRCEIPCATGWSKGEDDRCHRECPDGMVKPQGAEECELTEVGERKVCPGGNKYDDTFSGPNPLYVDIDDNTQTPDGTPEHPFHSIMDAVNAGGDAVTIFVAAGEYHEQVVLDGQSEVHLIGACADQVSLIGEGLEYINEVSSGVINVKDVENLTVDGFSLESDLRGIRVDKAAKGTGHLVIANVHLQESAFYGIAVESSYATIDILDNTVEYAADGGIVIYSAAPLGSTAEVKITGNRITNIVPCVGLALCYDTPLVSGIAAAYIPKLVVEGNLVAEMEYADGISAADTPNTIVRGNELRDIAGASGITVMPYEDGSAVVEDNWISDCRAGPFMGQDANLFYGAQVLSKYAVDSVLVSGNVLHDIRGFGLHTLVLPDVDLEISNNELVSIPWAISVQGDARIKGNRVYDSRLQLATNSQSRGIHLEGNEFRDGVDDDFGLTDSEFKTALNEVKLRLLISSSELPGDTEGSYEPVRLEGNRFADLGGDVVATVSVNPETFAKEVVIRHNVFELNSGNNLVLSNAGIVEATENRFVGSMAVLSDKVSASPLIHVGLYLISKNKVDLEAVTVSRNHFQDYGNGHALAFGHLGESDQRAYTVEENGFFMGHLITFVDAAGYGASNLTMLRNTLLGTTVTLGLTRKVGMMENRLVGSDVILSQQVANGGATFADNLFDSSSLVLANCQGGLVVDGNEFHAPLGVGLLVTASPGLTTIQDNLVAGTTERVWQGAGATGDGIHISGTQELGASNVVIQGNRIEDSARLGILVSGSYALVEGNMYSGNGNDCQGGCDFAVQYEPIGGADAPRTPSVAGADLKFVTRPDAPYAMLTAEDVLE